MSIGVDAGVIVTAFGLGVRHGIDWDHIAAISDLTAGTTTPRRQMRLAALYAFGHAVVILALGSIAILIGRELPSSVDEVMRRIVGVTLLALGIYVTVGVIRRGRAFRVRSRWMLMGAAAKRLWQRTAAREVVIVHDHPHGADHGHRHDHDRAPEDLGTPDDRTEATTTVTTTAHRHQHTHRGYLPVDPQTGAGSLTAFGIGMLHGVGAETPTQVLLFVAAAGAGGSFAGELLLVAFTVGLVASNTALAFAATAGLLQAERHNTLYLVVASVVGVFSLVIGTIFLLGLDVLPPIFSG
jgi:ABC-type nickel/cobalt efflux system permease component RcnA